MNTITIDNFLTQEDFKKLTSVSLKKTESNQISVYHNQIDLDQNVKAECLDEITVKKLNKNYHSNAMDILKKLYPEKCDLYEYSEFHIIETGANYKYPIHDDTPNKLLSGVIYLRPEKNSGTIFYKNKIGDEKKEVEWKQNRAVFFSRKEKSTWHSYQGDGKSNRVALVYNLMTNDIKKVCSIENKNYFFTKLRHSINPYLYRFFKFVI
tara:strand:- start:574 stop:1200 length:627 start_codon:yes stop_codon:yes gene_type:complete